MLVNKKFEHFTASHIEEVSTFIIGGSASSTGSDPWIVHLNFYQSGQLFCGGVIIGEDWVLSAAHCYQPLVFCTLSSCYVFLSFF